MGGVEYINYVDNCFDGYVQDKLKEFSNKNYDIFKEAYDYAHKKTFERFKEI